MTDTIVSTQLLNGQMIDRKSNDCWPELQEVSPVEHACDICPIAVFCEHGNEFDCRVHAMFSGFVLKEDCEEEFDNAYSTDEAILRAMYHRLRPKEDD